MKVYWLLYIPLLLISCHRSDQNTFSDSRDRYEYVYIEVANTIWMDNNLRYLDENIYNSGAWVWGSDDDNFDQAIESVESGACVLYNWSTAQNCCPEGWHLPSKAEWQDLMACCSDSDNPLYNFNGFHLAFVGKARAYDKDCLFDGDTYWTSDSSDNNEKGVLIAIQTSLPEGIICNFEDSEKKNAFCVRCIKDNHK